MADQEVSAEVAAPVQSEAPAVQSEAASSERMIPQSQVSKIVGREVHEAREKTKKSMLQEFEQSKSQTPSYQPSPASNMGGMAQLSEDQIRNMISSITVEETQKRIDEQRQISDEYARQQQGAHIAQTFTEKLAAGKERYADFDSVVGEIDFKTIPEIVLLTVDLDNTADVVYDLLSNPHKVASVKTNFELNKVLARRQIKQMSDAIKMNQSAQNTPSIPAPLRPISPSTVGTDNGSMSVKDYRSQSWLKG